MFTSEQTTQLSCDGFNVGTAGALHERQPSRSPSGLSPEPPSITTPDRGEKMEPDDMPNDVLIVEDDPIIALDFEDTLAGFGVKTVRTAGSVARALAMIADHPPDFALLDVGLFSEKTFAVAERLDALTIPYVFVTGYGADVRLPAALAGKPRLAKPCSSEALEAAMRRRSSG
jgi:CheY-like chemotaxis protein